MPPRFIILIVGLVLCPLLVPFLAYAEIQVDRRLSVVGWATSYRDLRVGDSKTEDAKFAATKGGELGVRLHTVYQLIVTSFNTNDGSYSAVGGGFRVGLPGFLWIGGPPTIKFVRRLYPVNTSIFGTILQTTSKVAGGASSLGTNMGFTIDVFLFNRYLFLSGQASILNFQGNGFIASGVGLGFEI